MQLGKQFRLFSAGAAGVLRYYLRKVSPFGKETDVTVCSSRFKYRARRMRRITGRGRDGGQGRKYFRWDIIIKTRRNNGPRSGRTNVTALRRVLYRPGIVILEFLIYYGNTVVRGDC